MENLTSGQGRKESRDARYKAPAVVQLREDSAALARAPGLNSETSARIHTALLRIEGAALADGPKASGEQTSKMNDYRGDVFSQDLTAEVPCVVTGSKESG